jgi:hypothetical protein
MVALWPRRPSVRFYIWNDYWVFYGYIACSSAFTSAIVYEKEWYNKRRYIIIFLRKHLLDKNQYISLQYYLLFCIFDAFFFIKYNKYLLFKNSNLCFFISVSHVPTYIWYIAYAINIPLMICCIGFFRGTIAHDYNFTKFFSLEANTFFIDIIFNLILLEMLQLSF